MKNVSASPQPSMTCDLRDFFLLRRPVYYFFVLPDKVGIFWLQYKIRKFFPLAGRKNDFLGYLMKTILVYCRRKKISRAEK